MKLRRIFRHLFTTAASGRRAFPPQALHELQRAIREGEQSHRAEVRIIIEAALPLAELIDGVHARARARMLFSDYRIWDTEENSGVLMYVNLADREVEILTDRGVGRLVEAKEWQAICDAMTRDFARGSYRDGAVAALSSLNALLAQRMPSDGQRTNQLSDRPIIL
ncbi:TPM domain-containing protein [Noviherbaspirillum pedocola]|uniref:TPM domain-containing protein n=1 Tax=Noviherbaspirillum pedocola TaxID=2801341 RepID=A0A934SWJ2_9BURK|nr:TPM domain-containing protein [Noviherbaspirillum pedocola]MBK4738121.1 TPM domain-containing protein [Noviherbaspirillum pedocola]